jgi:putative heme transporter
VSDEAPPSHHVGKFWAATRYVIGIAVGAFILILLFGKRNEFDAALRQVGHLNIAWEVGAFVAEALSVVGYAYVQRCVLQWSGSKIRLRSLTLVSLANIAIAYTIPGEPAVSSAYRYRFFRRHGASAESSAWSILTILIAQAIGMSLLLLVGVLIALTGHTSANETGLAAVGLVVVVGAGAIFYFAASIFSYVGHVALLAIRGATWPCGLKIRSLECMRFHSVANGR